MIHSDLCTLRYTWGKKLFKDWYTCDWNNSRKRKCIGIPTAESEILLHQHAKIFLRKHVRFESEMEIFLQPGVVYLC